MTMEIKNAKIKSVRLGIFERFWGAQICFDYNGGGQCAYIRIDKIRILLKVLSVKFWEDLPGLPCRVKAEIDHVAAIGHFIKEEWIEI